MTAFVNRFQQLQDFCVFECVKNAKPGHMSKARGVFIDESAVKAHKWRLHHRQGN